MEFVLNIYDRAARRDFTSVNRVDRRICVKAALLSLLTTVSRVVLSLRKAVTCHELSPSPQALFSPLQCGFIDLRAVYIKHTASV